MIKIRWGQRKAAAQEGPEAVTAQKQAGGGEDEEDNVPAHIGHNEDDSTYKLLEGGMRERDEDELLDLT
eukprot:5720965-Ditylum_brightwellii.AAC.1